MKKIISYLLIALPVLAQAQQVRTILNGGDHENSLYDIERIGKNEFWVAGENGTLKSADTNGIVSDVPFPTNGQNILRILNTENHVYLATDHGTLYRYSKKEQSFIKKEFEEFRNKCFYDLAESVDGKIIACGGTSGISLGEKRIPRGFIAVFNPDLDGFEVVYKSSRKFVWSMTEHQGKIYASVFNGFNSEILHSNDLLNWQKSGRVKGLIHEITSDGTELCYSGTRKTNYHKNGIAGRISGEITSHVLPSTGCIWSAKKLGGDWVMVGQRGEIIRMNDTGITRQRIPGAYTLYEIAKISDSRFMVSGHGGQLHIVELNPLSPLPDSL